MMVHDVNPPLFSNADLGNRGGTRAPGTYSIEIDADANTYMPGRHVL